MKKAQLLLWTIASLMLSCTPSNEEVAEKMMQNVIKENLYDPDSYEPISTQIDSMFIDITVIDPIMESSKEISKLLEKIRRSKLELNSAETSMDLWTPDGYSTHFSRGQYARAKKEKKEAKLSLAKYTEKLSEQLDSLKKNAAQFQKREFTGWMLFHKFRSSYGANLMGFSEDTKVTEEMIFFCNKELTACQGYRAYWFDKFLKVLKAVNEASSDEDLIDFFKEERFSL